MQDILSGLAGLGPWLWIIVGCLLLAAEALIPGVFLFWFGLAAVVVGGLSLVIATGFVVEAAIFSLLAALFVVIARRIAARRTAEADTEGLNERASGFLGRTFPLAEPIVAGTGRIKAGDTLWRVSGPDLPAGTPVTVTEVLQGRLVVAMAPSDEAAAEGR